MRNSSVRPPSANPNPPDPTQLVFVACIEWRGDTFESIPFGDADTCHLVGKLTCEDLPGSRYKVVRRPLGQCA